MPYVALLFSRFIHPECLHVSVVQSMEDVSNDPFVDDNKDQNDNESPLKNVRITRRLL